ncbi:MAG: hypothetical protein WC443_03260 [Desulfobaccales bacterium]
MKDPVDARQDPGFSLEAFLALLQLLHLPHEFAYEQLLVLLFESGRQGGDHVGAFAVERLRHFFQDDLGFGRFGEDQGNAAVSGQVAGLLLIEGRGIEDDGGFGDGRVEVHLPDQLIAIHLGEQNVGNYQVRMFGPQQPQSFAAVDCFQHPVPPMA